MEFVGDSARLKTKHTHRHSRSRTAGGASLKIYPLSWLCQSRWIFYVVKKLESTQTFIFRTSTKNSGKYVVLVLALRTSCTRSSLPVDLCMPGASLHTSYKVLFILVKFTENLSRSTVFILKATQDMRTRTGQVGCDEVETNPLVI